MRQRWAILAGLAIVAMVAYLPTLHQPLLEDDYPNIAFANRFGPVSGWTDLLHAPAFRLRATFQLLTSALYSTFDMTAAPYYLASIALHVLNTWLIFAMGAWRRIGYAISAWAALFFAVSEGHQEAVMWFSAASELLQFFFGVAALVCWIRFLQDSRLRWYPVSILCFALALLSKESAPIFLVLMALPVLVDFREKAAWLLPFLIMTMFAVWSIFFPGSDSFRFRDGSFSLHAPFWWTLPHSFFALLWFWGLLALAAARWIREHSVVWIGLAWAIIGLLPYSFLTYSTRIPSRQTYLASAGVALLVGAAFVAIKQRRPRLVPALAVILLVHNIGYLWTKKRAQFLDRAAPTEQLIALSRRTKGPIYVACFPRTREIAEQAVWLETGRPPSRLIWDAANAGDAAARFCYVERVR